MPILLAILTALAGIIWALYRLHNSGVDLNAFNPFYWFRRRKWQNQINTKPIHLFEKPMEAAALLLVAIAKLDGEITREQRRFIITLFIDEFATNEQLANDLYATSSYLLKDVDNIVAEVGLILAPSKAAFKPHHAEALIEMLLKVASEENPPNSHQNDLILEVKKQLITDKENKHSWE